MKHHFIFLLWVFSIHILYAQHDVIVKSDGKVGIGVTVPAAVLDISDGNWQFRIHNDDPGGNDWWIGSSADWWSVGRNKFLISRVNSSLSSSFTIDSLGYIGIGTTFPATRLHVLGGSDANVGTPNSGSIIVGNASGAHIAIDGNEIMAKGDDVSFGTLFLQNNGGNTHINGEIGLGMPPDAGNRLSIDGDVLLNNDGVINAEGDLTLKIDADNNGSEFFALQNGNGDPILNASESGVVSVTNPGGSLWLTSNYGLLSINSINTAGTFSTQSSSINPAVTVASGSDIVPDIRLDGHGHLTMGGDFRIYLDDNNNGSNKLELYNSIHSEIFSVSESGRVIGTSLGLGTSAIPSGYLLAVNGKAICEELKVQLDSAWPDYVFEDDYEFTPLEDLEDTIQSLGHLPGVPSADKIEKDGLEVGEMQRVMMEKIEELTLYVIELQKVNEGLQTQINDLRKTQ